jgi:hypothetical protein
MNVYHQSSLDFRKLSGSFTIKMFSEAQRIWVQFQVPIKNLLGKEWVTCKIGNFRSSQINDLVHLANGSQLYQKNLIKAYRFYCKATAWMYYGGHTRWKEIQRETGDEQYVPKWSLKGSDDGAL